MFIWAFTEELRDELISKGYKEIKTAIPISTENNRPVWIFDEISSSQKIDFSSKSPGAYLLTQKIFM